MMKIEEILKLLLHNSRKWYICNLSCFSLNLYIDAAALEQKPTYLNIQRAHTCLILQVWGDSGNTHV